MGATASHHEVQHQHRSINSRLGTEVHFENCTLRTVRVEWIGYDGKPRTYSLLRPGESYVQRTYCSHPWQFAAQESEATLVAGDAQVSVLI